MIELLIAATLPWCGVVEDMWDDRIGECEEVAGQSAGAGPTGSDLIADLPLVYIPSQYDADNPAGAIDLRIGPEPDADYWMIGVVPACIRENEHGDQVITRAGAGGIGEMFPGHYWSAPGGQPDPEALEDGGWLLAFDEDPCLVPATRAGVVYAGWSVDSPEPPPPHVGWVSYLGSFITHNLPGRACSTSLSCITVEVVSAPDYGTAGTLILRYRWHGHESNGTAGSFAASTLSPIIKASSSVHVSGNTQMYTSSAWGGGSPTIGATRLVTYNVTGLECVEFGTNSSGSTCSSHLTSITSGGGNGTLVPMWLPPGYPGGEPVPGPVGAYEGHAFLVLDDAFDDFIYIEPTREWETMDGVCDTQECLDTYCDGISALDLGDLVSCWLRWDVDWSDWFSFVGGQLDQAPFVSAMRYGVMMLGAYPAAVASLEGDCGELANMSGTPLEGFGFDTCVLPHQVPFRTIAGAFIYLAFVMFVWRSLSSFIQGGTPEEPDGVRPKGGAKAS